MYAAVEVDAVLYTAVNNGETLYLAVWWKHRFFVNYSTGTAVLLLAP